MALPPVEGLGNFQRRTDLATQLATLRSLRVLSATAALGTVPEGPMVNITATRPLRFGSLDSPWL